LRRLSWRRAALVYLRELWPGRGSALWGRQIFCFLTPHFACRHYYDLAYRSCQESDKRINFYWKNHAAMKAAMEGYLQKVHIGKISKPLMSFIESVYIADIAHFL
jgi:hypothetical protein